MDAQPGVADLSPFRERLPSQAQLVAQALAGAPPTLLQRQYLARVGPALTELARTAGALAATANALSPTNGLSAFNQLGVESSAPELVGGVALVGAQPAVHRLAVQQLANPQRNLSLLLGRATPTRLVAGSHRLIVRDATGSTTLAVQIDPSDTHEIALGELVRALNSLNGSVVASLLFPTEGTVQAVAAGRSPGRAAAFELADAPDSGAIVAWSGLGNVERAASDAALVLDGISVTLPNNQVDLQAGAVQVELKAPTAGQEVLLTVGPDRPAVLRAVELLAGALGAMAGALEAAADVLLPAFVAEFRALLEELSPLAASIGLTLPTEARAALDTTLLNSQLLRDPASVRRTIAGPDGLAQRLAQFANDVMSSPLSRFGAPSLIPRLPRASSHPTPTMLLAGNTLSSLLYAQLLAQGLLINAPT